MCERGKTRGDETTVKKTGGEGGLFKAQAMKKVYGRREWRRRGKGEREEKEERGSKRRKREREEERGAIGRFFLCEREEEIFRAFQKELMNDRSCA
jgi:hypothetical protein